MRLVSVDEGPVRLTGVPGWQLSGRSHVEGWLAGQKDPAARMAMLEWVAQMCEDPENVTCVPLNSAGVPRFAADVPGTTAFVDYIVVAQYRTVHIHRIDDVDHLFDLPPDHGSG